MDVVVNIPNRISCVKHGFFIGSTVSGWYRCTKISQGRHPVAPLSIVDTSRKVALFFG